MNRSAIFITCKLKYALRCMVPRISGFHLNTKCMHTKELLNYLCLCQAFLNYLWFCIHEEWPSLKLKKPKPYYYFDQFAKNETRLYHLGLVSVFNLSGVAMLSRIQKSNNFTVAKKYWLYITIQTLPSIHPIILHRTYLILFALFGYAPWSLIRNFVWNFTCLVGVSFWIFLHFCDFIGILYDGEVVKHFLIFVYILIDFFENNNIQK